MVKVSTRVLFIAAVFLSLTASGGRTGPLGGGLSIGQTEGQKWQLGETLITVIARCPDGPQGDATVSVGDLAANAFCCCEQAYLEVVFSTQAKKLRSGGYVRALNIERPIGQTTGDAEIRLAMAPLAGGLRVVHAGVPQGDSYRYQALIPIPVLNLIKVKKREEVLAKGLVRVNLQLEPRFSEGLDWDEIGRDFSLSGHEAKRVYFNGGLPVYAGVDQLKESLRERVNSLLVEAQPKSEKDLGPGPGPALPPMPVPAPIVPNRLPEPRATEPKDLIDYLEKGSIEMEPELSPLVQPVLRQARFILDRPDFSTRAVELVSYDPRNPRRITIETIEGLSALGYRVYPLGAALPLAIPVEPGDRRTTIEIDRPRLIGLQSPKINREWAIFEVVHPTSEVIEIEATINGQTRLLKKVEIKPFVAYKKITLKYYRPGSQALVERSVEPRGLSTIFSIEKPRPGYVVEICIERSDKIERRHFLIGGDGR